MSGYVPVARGAENTLEYRLFYKNAAGEAIRLVKFSEKRAYSFKTSFF